MLETFTADTFAPRVGETFRVIVDETRELRATLASARKWGTEADTRGGAARTPFTLTFTGPGPTVLPQQTYEVRHDELGAFEIFLVPVGTKGDVVEYEAVFT